MIVKKKRTNYFNKRAMYNFIGLFVIILNINLYSQSVFESVSKLDNFDYKCLWVESSILKDSSRIDSIIFFDAK